MTTLFSRSQSNRKYMGIIKHEVNKCSLSKISEVITKYEKYIKWTWSKKNRNAIIDISLRISKCIEVEKDWIYY